MNSTCEFTQDKSELNKIESKNLFENIKSKYILKEIVNNL